MDMHRTRLDLLSFPKNGESYIHTAFVSSLSFDEPEN